MNNENKSKSIITLAGEFKAIAELKDYCNKQYEFVEHLTKEIKHLQQENNHLKSLLVGVVPVLNTNITKIADEEMICIEQIKRLKDLSGVRELSLDETKKLDLLQKNLKLSREGSQEIQATFKPSEVPTQKLLELVIKKES